MTNWVHIGPYPTGPGDIGLASRFRERVHFGSRAIVGTHWGYSNGCSDGVGDLPYVPGGSSFASMFANTSRYKNGELVVEPEIFDIDTAGCAKRAHEDACVHPADVVGRIKPWDKVRRVTPQAVEQGVDAKIFQVPGTFAIEIVRARTPNIATSVLERVGTWLRVTPFIAGEAQPASEFTGINPGQGRDWVGSPFPFPFIVPVLGGGMVLNVRWELVVQGLPQKGKRLPALAGPFTSNPLNIIPAARAIVSPWDDMRYLWSDRYSEGHDWLIDGRGLLRLFCVFTVSGDVNQDNNTGFFLEIGGRLAGYSASVSTTKSALVAATRKH